MKEKTAKNGKKVAGVILSTLLIVGSLGAAATLAANSNDAVPKDAVISTPASPSPSDTASVTQGAIQYSKDVYVRADNSQNVSLETWFNPMTKDRRSDVKEYDSNHQLTKYQSMYYINGGTEYIIIQRDLNTGNPVSGTILKQSDHPEVFAKLGTNEGFDTIKQYITGSRWTNVGTEQTADGKTLNKLIAATYQSYINDTTQANMQLIEFVDLATGLPVKEELYEDSTGQFKLFSSDTTEYHYVADDGTLFKPADGVPMTTQTLTDGYGNSN
ncbi:hypothetical protein AAFA46_04040 [Oscillospiraceae bacterium WX1]